MQQIAFGDDDSYLNCWLQFNVAYRANVSCACYRAIVTHSGAATNAAAALECFQQYLFALEDLASWVVALEKWRAGGSLVDSVETVNARWELFERLRDADGNALVRLFGLPSPDDFREPGQSEYRAMLDQWAIAANDVGRFASRAAQNGGQLANRLQNKMKHGLHFAVAVEDEEPRAKFYAHNAKTPPGGRSGLPTLTLSASHAEIWVRRTYDVSRFLAAMLSTVYVARFGKDPRGAWAPRTEPNDSLSMDDIQMSLQQLGVPVVRWIDSSEPT